MPHPKLTFLRLLWGVLALLVAGSVRASSETDGGASASVPIFQAIHLHDPAIWETSLPVFAQTHSAAGFRASAQSKEERLACTENLPFLGIPMTRTEAEFKGGRLVRISCTAFEFHEGVAELDEKGFGERIKTTNDAVRKWLRMKPQGAERIDAAGVHQRSWFKKPLRVDLEWSISDSTKPSSWFSFSKEKFRVNFIRVVFSPYDGSTAIQDLIQ